MGTISSMLRAYASWDIDEVPDPGARNTTPDRRKSTPSSPERSFSPTRHLSKPRSPLATAQIDKAWLEFAQLCMEPEQRQQFDIEQDLALEKPIRIAILDTGVNQDHDALLGRVSRVRNFVPKSAQSDASEDLTIDVNGHGTFCTAIAVGGTYSAVPDDGGAHEECFHNGVAPFAKAVVGKVLDKDRRGDTEWLVRGIRWACDIDRVDRRRPVNADIVCITVGADKHKPELRDVILRALALGKIIVCSASNIGDDCYTIQYPAKYGDVICVGSHSENGQATGFTPGGKEMDFLGPGERVWSACSSGNDKVTTMRGMGVSAAFVAGVCALILAYAEKLGGQELRAAISNIHMMREILRRMSALPGHHDQVSGYGNLVPLRLLKYGPQMILDELYSMVKQKVAAAPNFPPQLKSQQPLQVLISNYTAGSIAAMIPVDKEAVKGLVKPLLKDYVYYSWYTGLRHFFFGLPTLTMDLLEPELNNDAPYTTADLSMPEMAFSQMASDLGIYGINLQNIIHAFFKNSRGSLAKLILPEFKHVSFLGDKTLFRNVNPRLVSIPGVTPLTYLIELSTYLMAMNRKTKCMVTVDNLEMTNKEGVPPKIVRVYQTLLGNLATKAPQISIYVQKVTVNLKDDVDILVESGSGRFRELLTTDGESIDTELPAKDDPLFFAYTELPSDDCDEEHNSPEGNSSSSPDTADKSYFRLWPELEAFYKCPTRQNWVDEYESKSDALRQAVLKGYHGALNICKNAVLAENVTQLDFRMNEQSLDIPESSVDEVVYEAESVLRIPQHMKQSSTTQIPDPRKVQLSEVLDTMWEKNNHSQFSVQEMALPPLSKLANIEAIFRSQFMKGVKNIYISGQVNSTQLLCILRSLPKGSYPLHIHIHHLLFSSMLDQETSRDIDPPPGIRVVLYDFVLDEEFFNMSPETVKVIYEICLKFCSLRLLEEIKVNCEMFLCDKGDFLCHYCLRGRSMESAKLLLKHVEDALLESMVYGTSILEFSREIFKYDIMISTVGKGRLRRAFKPVERVPLKLPDNTYLHSLTQLKAINSGIRNLKQNTVTVTVVGFGMNCLHPEFKVKIGPLRDFSRERAGLPVGEKIVGIGYNAVPEETMASIIDDGVTIGTVSAALIAGASCGAAPFANLVSLKVGTSSGRVTQNAIVEGLAWLVEREEQDLLPPSDIIYIPFNFRHYNPELYRLINKMSLAGKLIVCSSGRGRSREESRGVYPASFGDVLCIGSHNVAGELSRTSGRGRSVDLIGLGEIPGLGGTLSDMWYPSVAAAQVAGLIAYTLAYSEMIGGPSLRQAVSNNAVMRGILAQMCTKPGQHDESTGFGRIDPSRVFKHGDDFFKKLVSEATEEYDEIVIRRSSARRVSLAVTNESFLVQFQRRDTGTGSPTRADRRAAMKMFQKSKSPPARLESERPSFPQETGLPARVDDFRPTPGGRYRTQSTSK